MSIVLFYFKQEKQILLLLLLQPASSSWKTKYLYYVYLTYSSLLRLYFHLLSNLFLSILPG